MIKVGKWARICPLLNLAPGKLSVSYQVRRTPHVRCFPMVKSSVGVETTRVNLVSETLHIAVITPTKWVTIYRPSTCLLHQSPLVHSLISPTKFFSHSHLVTMSLVLVLMTSSTPEPPQTAHLNLGQQKPLQDFRQSSRPPAQLLVRSISV